MTVFSGFYKLNPEQRINYIIQNSLLNGSEAFGLEDYLAPNENQQRIFSQMIENYIGNFPLPMGVVTNMVINDETFIVPFVTEESSVIAAASKAAKFWAERGGFKASIQGIVKKGQVHFTWNGKPQFIKEIFPLIREKLLNATNVLTEKMRQRGGGITAIHLIDKTEELSDYYQIDVSFETADAMGANFINTCLEKISSELQNINELNSGGYNVEIIMAILSNYTPDCIVRCSIECPIEKLEGWDKMLSYNSFATKFKQSVDIANMDISRAVTHNKGIFNGIDAVLLATGNDWRAASASAHAYASKDGKYRGLTTVRLAKKTFTYELELPLAIGTVGGITGIHPVVKNSLAILKYPDAKKLMMIVAASGLASNFAAIASLITTGIQAGHMKMHLSNILNQLNANYLESESAYRYFLNKAISYTGVEEFIQKIRDKKMSLQGNKSYESRAKLMISGEYLVLKGALSLAIPLRFGQKLLIAENEGTPSIIWKSVINNDLWFYNKLLLPDFHIQETNQPDLSETLRKILLASKAMNSEFLNSKSEYHVTSEMDFNPEWGIGSSSSLISNIAYWAGCDPFKLNYQIFNGSGYDIACARSSSPIIYNLKDNQPQYREANFHPPFHEHLYFVYLNQKQNSKESIKKSNLSKINTQEINEISGLTLEIEKATNLEIFQEQIDQHEKLIGSIIKQKLVKTQLFNDFAGSVKSLGAWGGDFILAASPESDDYVFKYFKDKNLNTIFRYSEIVFTTKIN